MTKCPSCEALKALCVLKKKAKLYVIFISDIEEILSHG